jgi:hypothetical protein
MRIRGRPFVKVKLGESPHRLTTWNIHEEETRAARDSQMGKCQWISCVALARAPRPMPMLRDKLYHLDSDLDSGSVLTIKTSSLK